ncbi:Cobyrinic acid ac-diamide synthase [Thermodesulfobium narugense DSM 14796]|uniref:Cobyrinic acid ac-diamide synthase n=1 Tax=Thermodesulfobium narugense DSM 14796 TaxID=747365 RepID=M1E5T2_9BACT|nr:ATP-binding protein [Thermodesulfobium narugense]AEE15262.1 Cobyrinic acid ac-diamide synthase [Thermodesulfobium narugense DSM 14796]
MNNKPREIVVISGKGGTGKTSISASLAYLSKDCIVADCDVDAADLYLLLNPISIEKHEFYSGHIAKINQEKCIGCSTCKNLCRFDAIKEDSNGKFSVEPTSCEGCKVCVEFCPEKAIDFPDRLCGEWMKSETRVGFMVHAKLGIAAENSGKLVSLIRSEARKLAQEKGKNLIIIDGPPGIGCPVIASITGATDVLVVTEPTISGIHDLERVVSLANHFRIKPYVAINKFDLNLEITEKIEKIAKELKAQVIGKIRYDKLVTQSQIEAKTIVESNIPSAQDIIDMWEKLKAN